MPVVDELFARLGLDLDEAGFAKGLAAVGSLRAGMLAIGGAAAGFAVAIASAVKATVDYGSKVNDLSDKTGASTESLQALGYAASLSGASMEDLARAMNFAAKRGVKDVEAEFAAVADQVKALTDKRRGAEAAALAMQKFGRNGAVLVGTLKKGSAGIAELTSEARALGIVLDKEAIAAADDLGDEIDKANYAVRGLAYTFARELLPWVKAVVGAFVNWVKVNREIISQRLRHIIQGVGAALGAAALAAALLNLKLLLVPLAVIAIGAVFALIFDDILTYFQDGDSLLGRFLKTFNEFLKPQPEDGILGYVKALLGFIRDTVMALQDVQGLWERVKKAVPELVFGPKLGGANDVGGLSLGPTALAAGFGRGSDVASSFANSGIAPGGGILLQSPQVNQTVNINPPPGVSAIEVGRSAMNRSWDGINAALEAAREGAQ